MQGLVGSAGGSLEYIGRTIVVVGVIVNNDHQVAVAIVGVRIGECEDVPTLRAVERASVDHDSGSGVDGFHIGSTGEFSFGGRLDVDGAVVLDGRRRCIVVVVGEEVVVEDSEPIWTTWLLAHMWVVKVTPSLKRLLSVPQSFCTQAR